MEISVRTTIDGPKGRVWGAITDIDNCANMVSAIVGLKVLNRPDAGLVGLKWTETRKMFGKESSETMCITECREQDYYCTRAENHGAVYVTRMSVEEIENQTRLTMSFSGTSASPVVRLVSAVMGVFMKKPMIKMLEKDLNDIKMFVERASSAV